MDAGSALLQRIEATRAANVRLLDSVATDLRDAVATFDDTHRSVSSIEAFKDAVLRVADRVAPLADMQVAADAHLGRVVGLRVAE